MINSDNSKQCKGGNAIQLLNNFYFVRNQTKRMECKKQNKTKQNYV